MKWHYFDLSIGVEKTAELISQLSKDDVIFVPNALRANEVKLLIGENSNHTFLSFDTINVENDNYLYPLARGLADILVQKIVSCSKYLSVSKEIIPTDLSMHAFTILWTDQIVGMLRGPHFFRRSLPSDKKIIVHSDSDHRQSALDQYLKGKEISADEVLARSRSQLKAHFSVPLTVQHEAIDKNIGLLQITNLRDRGYRYTSLPIAYELSEIDLKTMLYCWHGSSAVDEMIELDLFTDRGLSMLEMHDISSYPVSFSVEQLGRDFRKLLDEVFLEGREFLRLKGALEMQSLLGIFVFKTISRSLLRMQSLSKAVFKLVDNAQCVMVAPGRLASSNLAVARARSRNIPTVEVQCGTMTATPRFVRPIAENILCIDSFSRDVFVDYFGCDPDKVQIIGSPKIDFDLKYARSLEKKTCEDEVASVTKMKKPLVVFASQPIGLERAEALTRLFIETAALCPEFAFLIKQHPNETPFYDKLYADLSKELGATNFFFDRDLNTYHGLVASEVVCTHFSTVGLEGFALGKSVAVLNPRREKLVYDLEEIGVATMVYTAEEFSNFVRRSVKSGSDLDERRLDASVNMLRDGKAAKRCAEFIEDLINKRAIEQMRQRNAARKRWSLKRLVGQS